MADLERELADRLIKSCTEYAYHELVAYAEGITIGELRDYLERGAVVGEKERDKQLQELRRFTRAYCQADAVFSRKVFKELREGKEGGGKSSPYRDVRPVWFWFERRWPCEKPLAIGSLLSSDRVEQLSLDEALGTPNADIQSALDRNGYFRIIDLENPGEGLTRALTAAGYSRAGPEPSPQE